MARCRFLSLLLCTATICRQVYSQQGGGDPEDPTNPHRDPSKCEGKSWPNNNISICIQWLAIFLCTNYNSILDTTWQFHSFSTLNIFSVIIMNGLKFVRGQSDCTLVWLYLLQVQGSFRLTLVDLAHPLRRGWQTKLFLDIYTYHYFGHNLLEKILPCTNTIQTSTVQIAAWQ